MKSLVVILMSSFIVYMVAMASTKSEAEHPRVKPLQEPTFKKSKKVLPSMVQREVAGARTEVLIKLKHESEALIEETILLHEAMMENPYVREHTISRQP